MVASRIAPAPNAGDIIWLNFDPQTGRKQAGRRPALVLSQADYNARANLAVMCPITSKMKGYPFEVAVKAGPIKGVILCDQVRSLDWRARNAIKVGRAPEAVMQSVREKIETLLGWRR